MSDYGQSITDGIRRQQTRQRPLTEAEKQRAATMTALLRPSPAEEGYRTPTARTDEKIRQRAAEAAKDPLRAEAVAHERWHRLFGGR